MKSWFRYWGLLIVWSFGLVLIGASSMLWAVVLLYGDRLEARPTQAKPPFISCNPDQHACLIRGVVPAEPIP